MRAFHSRGTWPRGATTRCDELERRICQELRWSFLSKKGSIAHWYKKIFSWAGGLDQSGTDPNWQWGKWSHHFLSEGLGQGLGVCCSRMPAMDWWDDLCFGLLLLDGCSVVPDFVTVRQLFLPLFTPRQINCAVFPVRIFCFFAGRPVLQVSLKAMVRVFGCSCDYSTNSYN